MARHAIAYGSIPVATVELPVGLPHDTAGLLKRLAAGPHGARPFTKPRKPRKPAPGEDLFAGGHTPLDLVELAAKGH